MKHMGCKAQGAEPLRGTLDDVILSTTACALLSTMHALVADFLSASEMCRCGCKFASQFVELDSLKTKDQTMTLTQSSDRKPGN
jgi:hypothetical protein